MRFGDYTLTVKDATSGEVTGPFMTFESMGVRARFMERSNGELKANEVWVPGVLHKTTAPLVGMPSALLDSLVERLNFTPEQRDVLQQLRYEMAPEQSFVHRFQHRKLVPGYSRDFMRAHAHYGFHFANYHTRAVFADPLREQINLVRASAESLLNPQKRVQIANFLDD